MTKQIFLVSIIFLQACSSIEQNRVAPGYTEAFNAVKVAIFGSDQKIDRNIIQNIPYASMLVKIGRGPEALMILESINNNKYTWVSADGIYLVIEDGLIVKSYGLNNNLKSKIQPHDSLSTAKEDLEYITYYSFAQPTLNNLKVNTKFFRKRSSLHKLAFGEMKLRLVEEVITSDDIAWREKNLYWLDENNYVWKSTQSISPKLPPISYEVTKKPL